ncbi:asparagine synthase [Colletotrichum karsti]|uniref:Asparagine synthase n=1 Tax=Colletotrichum karsti TaxID=1095194 RepID=A0A9P6IG25_9PEZI|nr:asparagine synthase [Colletotrichum karsti]KAF9881351.1 asparagine synthase [Colletotrichum karsti]
MCGISAAIKLQRSGSADTNGTNGVDGHQKTNGHNGNIGSDSSLDIEIKVNGNEKIGAHGTNGDVGEKHGLLRQQLQESLKTIAHRGPDASGIWINDDGSVAFGHCRLAINDLSPDGVQPLHSDDGKIHAIVNGEIYDHDAIRERCQKLGYKFKGHSDSEVLVALYKIHGTAFFEHLRGEFSFVIYDEEQDKIIAARDRFGIKPMFFTFQDQGADGVRMLLTSEMKGFKAFGWEPEWNVHGLISGDSMQTRYTVFKDVWKLEPGTWMELQGGKIEYHQYWDPDYKDKKQVETRTLDEMIEGVRERLVEAIKLRLRADVPVGIYLSGGIDSSVVAGIVTKLVRDQGVSLGNQDATKRITCFTIQFPETSGFNESDIAQRSADWLGVQILKKDMNEAELAKNFADAVFHTEHHNFDLNSVGKFCLSTLPRENGIPVVLTGEGADEHFAGYPFVLPAFLMEADQSWPQSPLTDDVRVPMFMQMSQDLKDMFKRIGMFEDESLAGPMPNKGMRLEPEWNAFAPWIRASYEKLLAAEQPTISPELIAKMTQKWHSLHTSLYLYTKGPLANMILTCLGDRTEMAHSIEARPPFLDHHLVEYVNGLPPSVKVAYQEPSAQAGVDNATGTGSSLWWKDLGTARQKLSEKWILKEAGKPFITQELYERRKHPYSAPVKWPRGGPIHNMMRELLTQENIENLGFLEWDNVKQWLEDGFSDDESKSPRAFRKLICTSSWVVLGQRFGVKKAVQEQLPVAV